MQIQPLHFLSAVKFNAGVPHLAHFTLCRHVDTTSPVLCMSCMLAWTHLQLCSGTVHVRCS